MECTGRSGTKFAIRTIRSLCPHAAGDRLHPAEKLRTELGKTLDLEGQRGAAIEQYRRVLQNQDFLGLHQDATRWTRKPYDRAAMREDNAAGGVVTLGSDSHYPK